MTVPRTSPNLITCLGFNFTFTIACFIGPPPLAKDVIDALPQVEISAEQVSSKLQCSVCWEDFQLKETVYQLPCQHVYHETCIRPWLELHGTCPICRQNLGNSDQSNTDDDQNGEGAAGGGNFASNTLYIVALFSFTV